MVLKTKFLYNSYIIYIEHNKYIYLEGISGGEILMLAFSILAIAAIAAWINTKIILEEIRVIKKHLGIVDDEPTLLKK